jgi:hypothetical protein
MVGSSFTIRSTVAGIFSPIAHAKRLTEIEAISDNCGEYIRRLLALFIDSLLIHIFFEKVKRFPQCIPHITSFEKFFVIGYIRQRETAIGVKTNTNMLVIDFFHITHS